MVSALRNIQIELKFSLTSITGSGTVKKELITQMAVKKSAYFNLVNEFLETQPM
jgi:hypothetical protein